MTMVQTSFFWDDFDGGFFWDNDAFFSLKSFNYMENCEIEIW